MWSILDTLCNHCEGDHRHPTRMSPVAVKEECVQKSVQERENKRIGRRSLVMINRSTTTTEESVIEEARKPKSGDNTVREVNRCVICRSQCEGCFPEEAEMEKEEEIQRIKMTGLAETVPRRRRPASSGHPPERCRQESAMPTATDADWGGGGGGNGKGRSIDRRSRTGSLLLIALACLFAFSWDTATERGLLGPGSLMVAAAIDGKSSTVIDKENGICRSIDVRNSAENLKRLADCRVIEGHLQIILMDREDSKSFENLSFPLLTEITDFLMIFRVRGLESLDKLFPNLAVIRGNALFNNYALICFQVFNLHNIGLNSLKYIGRGALRFEKNPELCFAESVDWTKILNTTHYESNQFIANRMTNNCDLCNETSSCPTMIYPRRRPACWDAHTCQVFCPAACPYNCDNLGNCCDKSCLGGCSIGNPRNCTACLHYSIGPPGDIKCVEDCPANFYRHMGRRCITAEHCRGLKKPPNPSLESPTNTFIPFEGECHADCPDKTQWNGSTCVPCPHNHCRKACAGGKIDSLSAAQVLNGCNIVKGSLDIQIRREGGLNVVNELKRFLSSIEVIHGHLKIARSDPLVSLTFFKNLKTIKGLTAEGKPMDISFTLMENEHLQDLFNDGQVVIIENGGLNFHTNPKLCMNKIIKLENWLKNAKFDHEAMKKGNGDRVACELTKLNVRIESLDSRGAVIEWDHLDEQDDQRSRLGYGIYYKMAPFRNVTLFDGRDACGFDGWLNDDRPMDQPRYVFTHLEPYTQYAFYVKTVQLATVQTGGQSDIMYFETIPDQPEKVMNVRVKQSDSTQMTIAWDPPRKANGNLTTYIVKCNLTLENEDTQNQRNYCTAKWDASINNPSLLPTPPPTPKPEKPETEPAHCNCNRDKLPTAADVEDQIEFEDALHNYVYTKRPARLERRRRSTDISYGNVTARGDLDLFPNNQDGPKYLDWPKKSIKNGTYFTYLYKELSVTTTSLNLTDLKHFGMYTISIVACHSGPVSRYLEKNCSAEVIRIHRTEPLPGADDIKEVTMESPKNNSGSIVRLSWQPPPKPNGMVLAYHIRTRHNTDHAAYQLTCITAKDFEARDRIYDLRLGSENGNYSIEVQVTSLSGPAEFSSPIFAVVNKSTWAWWAILLMVMIPTSLIVGAGVYLFLANKRKEKNHRLFAEVNPDYDAAPYIPDEYEIPRERVKRERELGQGSFGMVYAGTVQMKENDPTETPCAIKTVNDSDTARERSNFLREAHVMKAFHTAHVVRLLGVVSLGDPPLVVMELMALGDLKGYLRAHRLDAEPGPDGEKPIPPSVRQTLQMAIEIADGMSYLSYKKFVHRDLAARNCMVAGDLTVKIGDFGMTRDIYETDYYRKGDKGLLPVRWMSPESLKDGVFTTSNDVFSYGVVLWEMATLASQPYQGLSNDQVLRYVIDGGVMERPEQCPDKLYKLMRRCWEHRPSKRPTFLDIVKLLLDDAGPNFYRNSFFYSEEGEEYRFLLQNESHHPDEGTTLLRPENEMSNENARENWEMPNNNNNSRRLLEEGGAMPIIKPAQSPLRFLTGKSGGNDYKESKF